jgi:multidrug efflux pump
MMGYSINLLTLLAMVLAIGLVVDDAIVVVENIHRHLERGERPLNAAIGGMREIFTPVIAMTITLAAVYAPIGFTQGLTGALFREFAVTLAGAVVISGFIALTLSPMIAARVLKSHEGHGEGTSRFQRIVDRSFERLSEAYGRRVRSTLGYRWATLSIVTVLSATMVFLFLHTSRELAPEEDIGFMFSIVNAPAYATSNYTEAFVKKVTDATKDVPEVNVRFSVVGFGGTNTAFAGFGLTPWSERSRGQAAIQQDVQNRINGVAGVQAFVFAPPTLPGTGGGLPVQYVIRSIGGADQTYEIAEEIKNRAQASGRFIVVQDSLAFDQPQALVTIDRDRAAALGVPVSDIGLTLTALVGGGPISKFDLANRSYDVITQVDDLHRFNPESLGSYYVRSESGAMLPLSAVVSFQARAAPVAIEQFNQLNSATISAIPLPGVATGDALNVIRDIAREVMPAGFYEDFAGQSRLEINEGNSTLVAFGLAIIIIYLVLAAQFESFRDPLVIMLTVPMSIFGALVPLNLGVSTLNIYTEVGLITLIGLITKHGILMVQFANQQRAAGSPKFEAIVEAARVRLRPILMTTAAMVLGVMPLIIASGAGAKARFSIGLVIAAGMAIGTLFTLFVLPMFYTYIARSDEALAPEEPELDLGGAHAPANADNVLPGGGDFPYPSATSDVHHEIELVAALSKGGDDIPVENALDHVFGYAVGLDMTRRDLQGEAKKLGRPWEVGKAFECSAPMSAIAPAAMIGHPQSGAIWLDVNGKRAQEGDLGQLIWKVPEAIAYLSRLFRVAPGDLIMTGTPVGVGPVKRGDALDGHIDGVADLHVRVV